MVHAGVLRNIRVARKITSRIRQVLNRWFWLNYAVALLLTSPLPMINIVVNGQLARRVPVWECYADLLQGKISKWAVIVVALHLGMSFAICFIIWWLMMPRPPKQAETSPEPLCDTGTAEPE